MVKRTMTIPQLAQEFDLLEAGIDTICTVCAYIAVPGVPTGILCLQLEGLDHELNDRLKYYRELLALEVIQTARKPAQWAPIFKRIKDIQAGIAAALDKENPDDGKALRSAVYRHMRPDARARYDQWTAAYAREEKTRAAAAEQTRRESHLSDAVKVQWETERRIVTAVLRLKSEGRTQIGAARHYLKMLTDRKNGIGQALTDEERAEFFYLDGEKSKGDKKFGDQISEIVGKHGGPKTLTVT